jgi:pimeloyl-ACP methyl ester carboxylesterase
MWTPQLEHFAAQGLYITAPDMRWHGRSGSPTPFSIEACARDLHELLQALELEQVSMVGVSMGGLIVQQLACDYPAVVEKLVIVDSFSQAGSSFEKLNAWLAALALQVMPLKLQAKLTGYAYRRMGHVAAAEYLESQMLQAEPRKLRTVRKEVNQFSIGDRLSVVQVPTLVLVGEGFGKLAVNMARKTAEFIPHAQLQILPGGGDPSNLTALEAFKQAVLGFIHK